MNIELAVNSREDEYSKDGETLYQFYNSSKVECGLQAHGTEFRLNDKEFQIFSGSLHYFRILPSSWETSIKKMKHCQLNTICSYVPWNLHEKSPGLYDFHGILDLEAFIKLVQEEDMFMILRIGPYICAELDYGGLPSWLLRDQNMQMRSNYPAFLLAVDEYFAELVTRLYKYQFSVSGGPIIAVQVENEFAAYGDTQANPDDRLYMTHLRDTLRELGLKEMLFTCDMPSMGLLPGSVDDVLMTANFQTDAQDELNILRSCQPNKPLMVAEFWSGWFDHWGEEHNEIALDTYVDSLKIILNNNASFNIYVFQGGTNFELINGANVGFPKPESPYCSTVTSYDYGALLTEDGRYTEKYKATHSILKLTKKGYLRPDHLLPFNPSYLSIKMIPVRKFLPLEKMLPLLQKFEKENPVPMEMLHTDACEQSFGFILYQTKYNQSGSLKFNISRGTRTLVLINYACTFVLENTHGFQVLNIEHNKINKHSILCILVENLGRINFTETQGILNDERRGILGDVTLNDIPLTKWNIFPLSFNKKIMQETMLLQWSDVNDLVIHECIGFYYASLSLDNIKDTFIYSYSWTKGVVLVNSFNIGRYWKLGPQQTLYLPGSLLKKGLNEILALELHTRITDFEFKNYPILNEISKS